MTRVSTASSRIKDDTGFTMIEVMVGAVLSLIVVAAALALLMVSQKTTIINGQVAATQQNSRSAMELAGSRSQVGQLQLCGKRPRRSNHWNLQRQQRHHDHSRRTSAQRSEPRWGG